MRVSTNTVGNYQPTYIKAAAVSKNQTAQNINSENISIEEKKFFAGMYPARQEEIMSYQSYNSKGKVSGVHVGSLFDRRG